MNVERMLYLADQLENPTDPKIENVKFDMQFFRGVDFDGDSRCGTVACIGGHACLLFGEKLINGVTAAAVLGLNYDQKNRLFYNYEKYVSPGVLGPITRAEAVAAIRRMVQEHIDASVAALVEGVPSIIWHEEGATK